MAVRLATSDDVPAILGYYQSLGFAVTGEHTIKARPRLWFMSCGA